MSRQIEASQAEPPDTVKRADVKKAAPPIKSFKEPYHEGEKYEGDEDGPKKASHAEVEPAPQVAPAVGSMKERLEKAVELDRADLAKKAEASAVKKSSTGGWKVMCTYCRKIGVYYLGQPYGEKFIAAYKPDPESPWPSQIVPCQVCKTPLKMTHTNGKVAAPYPRVLQEMTREEYATFTGGLE